MRSMTLKPLMVTILLLAAALVSVFTFDLGSSDAYSQGRDTWQVETSLSQSEMKTFVEALDENCDIDIEPQGVSNYIVAYRCGE